jgi:hypothetical protein
MNMEIINQIQADLINEDVSLSAILRKAKVLSSQLESDELANWVSDELDGYYDSELPDYRLLDTSVSGTWTNGYWVVNNRALTMFSIDDDELRNMLTTFPVGDGIKTVEQYANLSEDQRFQVPADITTYVNTFVSEGGYGYAQLHFTVGPHDFEQILDTVRNRLLDFILKLDKKWNPENPPPEDEDLKELVSVSIYNNPYGGNMSVFDQRGQNVNYQFNAGNDINIDTVNSKEDLSNELFKINREIDHAKNAEVIPDDIANEAQYRLVEASRELQSENSSQDTILSHLGKAKELLNDFEAAVGLVTTLVKAADVVSELFA